MSKPGPQPCNQIAGTANEQIARALIKSSSDLVHLQRNADAAIGVLEQSLGQPVDKMERLIHIAIHILEGEP